MKKIPAINPIDGGMIIYNLETGQIGEEAVLFHEWRNIPESITQGNTGEFDHYLEERNGVPVENILVEYVLDPEDTGGGEPERTLQIPVEEIPGNEDLNIDWNYTPLTSDGEHSENVDSENYNIEVEQPLNVEDERTVNFQATPNNETTSPERLL